MISMGMGLDGGGGVDKRGREKRKGERAKGGHGDSGGLKRWGRGGGTGRYIHVVLLER